MAHKPQATASAEHLAAENAMLARAVTRMATLLRNTAEDAPWMWGAIMAVLASEEESIKRAAGVWPPVDNQEGQS